MATDKNTSQSHVIYLLNLIVLWRHNWHVASHDSLSLHAKINHIQFEDIFFDKSHAT